MQYKLCQEVNIQDHKKYIIKLVLRMFRQTTPTLEMLYCAVLLYFEQSEKRCSKFKRAYLQQKNERHIRN